MNKEVLLINPPFSRRENYRCYICILGTKSVPPLGLAYLAAFLEREGIEVRILDAIVREMSLEDLVKSVYHNSPIIIGITATTPMFCNMQEVVRRIKHILPKTNIVLGGPHVSALPYETLREVPEIDFIVIGEGESTFLELCKAILNKQNITGIKGLGYRKNGNIVINPSREYIKDLDVLPFPARHLLPMHLYRPSPVNYRYLPATSVICSRGCPMECIFCTKHIFGRQLRLRSPENVFLEIKQLRDRYAIKEIHFYDDTFTLNKDWMKEVCGLIKRLRLVWWCNGRVDDINEEMLKAMKDAGCYRIYFGVESAHEKSLQVLKKKTAIKDIISAFRLTRRCKIETAAFMMLGIPGETKRDMEEGIRFVKKLNADHAVFTVLTPYPGTELYSRVFDYGKIHFKRWDDFVMISESPIFLSHSINERDLKQALRSTYRNLIFSHRYIMNKIKDIFYTPHKLVLYAKGLFSFLKEAVFSL